MNKFALAAILLLLFSLQTSVAQNYTPGQAIDQDFQSFAKPFLENHCIDCHGSNDPEAGLSLEDLGPVDDINAGT